MIRQKTLSTNRGPVSNKEHEQIMLAIKDKDADLAEQLANQHMINAYSNMVKYGLYDLYSEDSDAKEDK